ncbi:peptidase [Zhengella mangrovi]|uniref:Peptidase n=1 Tax=Zhengella mangrovi TaxID=1982044 RepID=A0A2G1QUE1_9HYPH|nr:prepilin peptidase [Zhengella mangrovi]PHP69074.1 peptidase [Zhengella mangrovi]
MLEAAILVIFPFCMVFAAISDMLSMTIANRVTLLLIAGFAVIAPLTGMPWTDFGLHFLLAALVLAITYVLFALGQMGGGDAKLLTGTVLWFGFTMQTANYLLYAAFLGGMLTLAILMLRSSSVAVFAGRVDFLRRIADPKEGIPYGIALGVAGLAVFPESTLGAWALASIIGG